MVTTGAKYPTLGASVSESPWSDNAWTTPANIYSDNAATANVTASSFDNGDQTYVLKATGFDFSGIPDGSSIDGVIARVNTWYRSGQGSGSLDLCQLLNTSKAKVGTNQCSAPVALTTTNTTVITKGSSSDLWGNELTAAWVKNSSFGVALGIKATAANADVDIDYVTLEVYYTEPPPVYEAGYSGQSHRACLSSSSYAGQVTRMISVVADYTGNTSRNILLLFGNSALTTRIVSSIISYSGQTLRAAQGVCSYIGDTSRKLSSSISYNGLAQRTIQSAVGYSANGIRHITELASYSGKTMRNILSALVAEFTGRAIRKISNLTAYTGKTRRIIEEILTTLASFKLNRDLWQLPANEICEICGEVIESDPQEYYQNKRSISFPHMVSRQRRMWKHKDCQII